MSSDLWGSTTESDHDLKLTLPGSAETLRPRLIEALERLDYKVLDEQPLHAKRRARGSASWNGSFNALDYPRKLGIGIKPLNDVATLVTFSYEVKAATCLTRGDRQTLDAEAEAIAALVMQRVWVTSCTACGTEITDDSRFCRKCGAPLAMEVAELEVLRLMEGGRKGYRAVTIGVLTSLFAALLPVILIWINTAKAAKAVGLLSAVFGMMGLVILFQGMWQLYSTLNPAARKKSSSETRQNLSAPQPAALPSRPAQLSVTEGTTELLISEERQTARVAVPVERKKVDTAEVK